MRMDPEEKQAVANPTFVTFQHVDISITLLVKFIGMCMNKKHEEAYFIEYFFVVYILNMLFSLVAFL